MDSCQIPILLARTYTHTYTTDTHTLPTHTQAVDADNSGKITAVELQQALLNNNWSHFNAETCRLLIGMFDRNK